MLSGEILIRSPLSVAILPPPSIIELCRTMAAIATLANQQNIDDDDIYLENGLLSYENPNYHMDPQRMERNSHLYEEIISELQQQGSLRTNGRDTHHQIVSSRKGYACLDIGSMGVDLKENFSSPNKQCLLETLSPNESKTKSDQIPENDDKSNENNKDVDDLYAKPNKKKHLIDELSIEADHNEMGQRNVVAAEEEEEEEKGRKEDIEGIEDKDGNTDLPPGWEKHEDIDGPYYWHIKSGTIQREPPVWPKDQPKELKTPILSTNPQQFLTSVDSNNSFSSATVISLNNPSATGAATANTTIAPTSAVQTININNKINNSSFSAALNNLYGNTINTNNRDNNNKLQDSQSLSVTRSNTSSALDQEEEKRRKEDLAYKRRSYPLKSESDRPIRFAVRSLGWVEIAEEDLTPERSSKAVNKCIVDLSLGRNDLLDVVGRWGDGKDLFMDLDEGALKLIDPENLTILNTQPIHTIRVWGVGRDNGRDFAYVARDRLTRIHMCHVFRCDTAARTIANTLRDICKRIMIERSLQLDGGGGVNANSTRFGAIRPTDLPTENRRWVRHPQSFPTPMEEPKKVLKAQYLGSTEVSLPSGMDTLNSAIDRVHEEVNRDQWENVNVSVAPSMISINTNGEDNRLVTECRVRYLSFLGIGKNVKNCAFIMHTAQDKFIAHVFHCEPSSGALCKTIEAACKLRYQKCLDAHPESSGRYSADSHTPGKGIGATLKNLMNSFTLKKDKASSS